MASDKKVRRYARVSLPKAKLVAWEHLGERSVSTVRVLGLGGLFICTPHPPPAGDYIQLVFEVPGGDVRARALVCNSRPREGMGIQFVSMGHEARARLNRLLTSIVTP
jgi:PilZ domain